MAGYKRSTTELASLGGLRPELAESMGKRLEADGLTGLADQISILVQTTSERIKPGLLTRLFGDPLQYIAVLLGPGWLVIGRSYSKAGALPVLMIRLADIKIATAESHSPLDQMAVYPEEDGITIYGLIGDARERSSFLIPLGTEPAAQKLRERLKQAIAKA